MIYVALLLATLYAGSCRAQMGGMGMGGGMGGMGPGGCTIDQKCFGFCQDTTLADAFPFVRQTPVSCEDCMKLCNKLQPGTPPFSCASAVYDASVGSCDIFAVSVQGQGMGMGRRKRQQQKQPKKQSYPGRILLTPTGMCAGQGGNDTGAAAGGTGGTTAAAGGSEATTSAGAETTTSTAASTTTSASAAKKKMIKDQAPIRRKDAVTGRCLAARTSKGVKDCNRGTRFVGPHRQMCKPTPEECKST